MLLLAHKACEHLKSLTRDVMTGCRDTLLQEAVFAVHCAAAGFTSVQLKEKHKQGFKMRI